MNRYYYVFVCVFLSCGFSSYGMQQILKKAVAPAVAIAPVVIPGTYYYANSGRGEDNLFRGFVPGVILGTIPFINIWSIIERMVGYVDHHVRVIDRLIDKIPAEQECERPIKGKKCYVCHSSPKERAATAGIFAGVALYGSIPHARWLTRRLR